MNVRNEIEPLLEQHVRAIGRGKMIAAHHALVEIVRKLAAAIDRPPVMMRPPEATVMQKPAQEAVIRPEKIVEPVMLSDDEMVGLATLLQNIQNSAPEPPASAPIVKRPRGRPRKHPR